MHANDKLALEGDPRTVLPDYERDEDFFEPKTDLSE